MKALIDTCVVVDFLQAREPFALSARELFRAAASDRFAAYITAKSATDIHYLMRRFVHSEKEARRRLDRLLSVVGMLDSAAADVRRAIASDMADFEDAVMAQTAVRTHMDCIITRNVADFEKSPVSVFSPERFLELL